jgi:MFS family permease
MTLLAVPRRRRQGIECLVNAQPIVSKPDNQKWRLVVLLFAGLALDYFSRLALFSTVPLWARDLHEKESSVGLLVAAFLLTYGCLSPIAGFIGDRVSRRKILVASVGISSIVTVASSAVVNGEQLIVLRVVLGIAQVAYIPVGQAFIADFHRSGTQGRASGLFLCGAYLGILLSGFPAAWIATNFGWRAMLQISGGLGIILAAAMFYFLPGENESYDQTREGYRKRVSMREVGGLLRNRVVLILMCAFGLVSIANWVLFSFLPLFVYRRYGLSLERAAFDATVYVQLSAFALIPVCALLSDRIARGDSRRRFLFVGLFSLVGLPSLIAISNAKSGEILVCGLVGFGMVLASTDSGWLPMLCTTVGPSKRGTAYGLLNFSGTIAGGLCTFWLAEKVSIADLGGVMVCLGLAFGLVAGIISIAGYHVRGNWDGVEVED